MGDFDELLARCGVTDATLTAAEREALDERGYVVLANVVDRAWLERLRAAFEEAARREQPPGQAGRSETGTRHVGLAREPDVLEATTHPRVLAAVHHVLGRPFRVMLLSGRDPLPGYGLQGLHTDWVPRTPQEPYAVATALWLLDDFEPTNGATRVVPGSHRVPRPLPKSMQAPSARHPEQVLVTARAGSVLVFNGHLWHSGTRNDSRDPRRVLQCQLRAAELFRPDEPPPEGLEALEPTVRALLGG